MAYTYITPSPSRASWSPKSTFSEPVPTIPAKEEESVQEEDVVQGRLFWLPPKEELPVKAVRRAHGKGAVEEGIYNHPIIAISRPAEDGRIVHFHLITSFQGKKLHEIYGKSNEFHTSRRSWYLPISPAPDHPDANSKKSKKRFPTLKLAHGAVLRWDSYVNLRHVYKIDWTCLRPYSNPDTPWIEQYRLERESVIRMLAKGRVLTTYEPGVQYKTRDPKPTLPRSYSEPQPRTRSQTVLFPEVNRASTDETHIQSPPKPYAYSDLSRDFDRVSIVSEANDERLCHRQSPFLGLRQKGPGSILRPPRGPPDGKSNCSLLKILGVIV